MDVKLQKVFWVTFPDILKEKDLPCTETCMCWGFEIGNGWTFLLWELCKRIKALQWFHDCRVIATQVKEKFGRLNFYYRVEFPSGTHIGKKIDVNNQVFRLTVRYEIKSTTVCEVCGKPAKRTLKRGWVYTRCKKCLDKSPF